MAKAMEAAATEQSGTLNERQWEGLGKVGDAALQAENLLQLLRDILSEIPEAVDADQLLERLKPQLESLRGTAEALLAFLKVDSVEAGAARLRGALQDAQAAHLDESLGEVLQLLGNLHKNGFFASVNALSAEMKCPLIGENPDDMIQKVHAARENLAFWLNSAKEGVGVVGNLVAQMDLPDRLDEIQEMADEWLKLAKRVQKLLQGDAPNLHARLSGLVEMAEILGGQMNIAIGTLRDTVPEVLGNGQLGSALATIGAGGSHWMRIAIRVKALAQGENASLADRMEGLVEQIEHLAGYGETLRFFLAAGKQGLDVARDMIGEANLADKLDDLQDAADQWLKIALRAKALAQGNADNLAERVSGLLDLAESVSQKMQVAAEALAEKGVDIGALLNPRGDMAIAFGTATDMATELWNDGTVKRAVFAISEGVTEWMEVVHIAQAVLQGNAPTFVARVKELMRGLEEAHLIDMLPELFTLLGAIQKSGLLHKVNLIMASVGPMIPSDEAFAAGVQKATRALEQTQREMRGEGNKGGGIFGLIKIVFAKDTQYVLRFAVRFLSTFLRALKS